MRKVRRSLMEAISARLIAARSSASAIGSPWKLPAEMISPESGKMSGLSVTESTSTLTTRRSHVERVAAGAVHLRDAAQRVGVLHLVAVEVAEHDGAPGGGSAHVGRRDQLAGDGTQRLDALLEGADGGAQALQAHRADQVGGVQERLAVGHQHAADGGHELGAVQEAEALFGLEGDGREPGGLQGRPARLAPPVLGQQLALAHHRQHEVRGRGEVAGGAERAPRRHPRHDVGVDARGQHARPPRAGRPSGRAPWCSAGWSSRRARPRARAARRARRRGCGPGSPAAPGPCPRGCGWSRAGRTRW